MRGAVWYMSFRKKSKGGMRKVKGGLKKVKGGLKKEPGLIHLTLITFAYNLHSIWLINSKASLLSIIKIITIAQIVETGRKRITTITTKNDVDVLWFFWATSKLNCWRIIVRWTLTNSLKWTQKVPEHDTQLRSACITQPHQTSTILQWLAYLTQPFKVSTNNIFIIKDSKAWSAGSESWKEIKDLWTNTTSRREMKRPPATSVP